MVLSVINYFQMETDMFPSGNMSVLLALTIYLGRHTKNYNIPKTIDKKNKIPYC